MSAIGAELSTAERAWLFAGHCPDCGQTTLIQGAPDGVAVKVNGAMETAIICDCCGFRARMLTNYSAEAVRAIGASHDR